MRAFSCADLSNGSVSASDVANVIGCYEAHMFGDDWQNISSEFCRGFLEALNEAYDLVEKAAGVDSAT